MNISDIEEDNGKKPAAKIRTDRDKDQNPPLLGVETRATRSSSVQKGQNKARKQPQTKPVEKKGKKTFGSKRDVPDYSLH